MRSQLNSTGGERIKNNCNCIPLFHWPDSCSPPLSHQSRNPPQNHQTEHKPEPPDLIFSVNNSPDKHLRAIPAVPPLICFCDAPKRVFAALSTWIKEYFAFKKSRIFSLLRPRVCSKLSSVTTGGVLGKISGTLTSRAWTNNNGINKIMGGERGIREDKKFMQLLFGG